MSRSTVISPPRTRNERFWRTSTSFNAVKLKIIFGFQVFLFSGRAYIRERMGYFRLEISVSKILGLHLNEQLRRKCFWCIQGCEIIKLSNITI